MPANREQRISDLLDRWVFAGALLLMEVCRYHAKMECCRFEGEEPRLCLGMQALTASIEKLCQESREFIR